MNDLSAMTVEELRKLAAKLRHPGAKAKRLLVRAELRRREDRKLAAVEPEEKRDATDTT